MDQLAERGRALTSHRKHREALANSPGFLCGAWGYARTVIRGVMPRPHWSVRTRAIRDRLSGVRTPLHRRSFGVLYPVSGIPNPRKRIPHCC